MSINEKKIKVDYMDLGHQWQTIKDSVTPKINDFFERGHYIGGGEVESFENAFCEYAEVNFAIGCSNGTDGLKLALQCLELKGSTHVVMPANTYIADAFAVKYQKGDWSFEVIDHDEYYQIDVELLEKYISNIRNKYDNVIIIPVHLYGHVTDMPKVMEIAKKYKCYVIEDASQAHGAVTAEGKMVGQYGDLCVYSCYPGKNLGAIGDAGIITTNNSEYHYRLQALRNLGCHKKYEHVVDGWNNRLDSVQAIILEEKLKHLDAWNKKRIEIADVYNRELEDIPYVKRPEVADYCKKHVYHVYCVQVNKRDELQEYLKKHGIHTIIHYPIPIKSSKCNESLNLSNYCPNTYMNKNNILSLPMHQNMTEEQVLYVCDLIKEFYGNLDAFNRNSFN
jgi:dTDP-4-amino-4,6-dideoxygalactose transaminase